MYSFTVWEARSIKSRSQWSHTPSEDSRGEFSWPLEVPGGTVWSLACVAWLSFCLSSQGLVLCVAVFSLLSLIRNLVIGFKTHSNNAGRSLIEILDLHIFKTLILNKVTFTNHKGLDVDISFGKTTNRPTTVGILRPASFLLGFLHLDAVARGHDPCGCHLAPMKD